MISLEEVQALYYQHRKPVNVAANLIEYPGGNAPPEYYAVRMYRDNFDKLTPMDKMAAINWANETLQTMNILVPASLEVWRRPGVRK